MFNRSRTLLLVTSALVPLGLAAALANPLGPQVVGGGATVQGQGTPTVTVTQSTDKAIINWNSFNIGAGEKTNIFQPNASSVELDRVTGGLGLSEILGSLWSNGHVFLVNPDGILFGPGAKVDTAGFLATTNGISNADFMAGRYNFSTPGNLSASIVNQGSITASNGGFAALVAPGVRNSGTITATLGTIALGSGNGFTLDFYGDKLITLGVNDSIAATVKDVATGLPLSSLVRNSGTLKANGGTVELTAVAARQVVDSVINNTGVIEANTIGNHNGMIVLSGATAASKPAGAPQQTVKVSGTLSAAGKKTGTTGGTIEVTGENISLTGATLDASGRKGGGAVLIGGDVGGGNPSPTVASIPQAQLQAYAVPIASTVTVDAATTINASATDSGNGGKVVVWSAGTTAFNGSIMATGGVNGGNGGFVETSGHVLDFASARVDTTAPYGKSGLWLLDPYDLTIDFTAAQTIGVNLGSTDVTIQTTASGTSGPGNQTSGPGDIIVNSSISWNSAHSLTLSAYRNVDVSANIANTGGAAVTLRADNTGTGVGTVSFNSGAQVSTAGLVSIFYNPIGNDKTTVNATSYTTPTNFSGDVTGGGLLTAYMLVNTIYDLQNIQNNLSGAYALGANIDATATAGWNSGAGFAPIGNGVPFIGTLDGQSYAVDKLTIAPTASNIFNVGLFGMIGVGGGVKNLNLTNVKINANASLGPGFQSIGALAGTNAGLIDYVYASGTINGGTVNGVSAGGLVGQNGFYNPTFTGGTIQNSSAAVSVTLGDGVGCTGTSCTNSRTNVAGGLVGQNGGTITGSSASGAIVVGANSQAGGLVGVNQRFDIHNNPVAGALIDSSFATGPISSNGVNVSLGGLVGFNFTDALITSSYATGSVIATGTVTATTSCSTSIGCLYESAGGLVGQNSGTINGTAIPTSALTPCGAGWTCAGGTVSVGSGGQGGGLVGWNNGIIEEAFATGAVTGAAGLSSNCNNCNGETSLAGLVGSNQGLIQFSYATGDVGTLNVAYLQIGGLVADNGGTIRNSYAAGNVRAGANSQAGGLTSSNSSDNNSCIGCIVGDGFLYYNTATINNSHAIGNVTVGNGSLAGGLAGSVGGGRSGGGGTVDNSYATGAVSGGGNSILGGLIGVTNITALVTNSTVTSIVTSTGSNSWVGGFIGVNGGTVSGSNASGPVTGTSDSLIGGFVALNLGVITGSTTALTSTVTGTGVNSFDGGFVGVNFGTVDSSTAAGNVTGGTSNFVGGFAGAKASLPNITTVLIPGSSFPVGTISTGSAGTGTVNGTTGAQVGTTNPASFPASPSIVASCTDSGGLCSILQAGLTLASPPPPPPPPPPPGPQINPPSVDIVTTPPPILASLTPPSSSTGAPLPAAAVPGEPGFIPPPLPQRSVPGPNGETRSFIPPIGETRLVSNQLILQFGNLSVAEIASLAQSLGLQIIASETVMGRRLFTVQLPNGRNLRDLFGILDNNKNVSAAPIYKFTLTQADPVTNKGDSSQYVVNQLHLDKVHAIATGKGITIALIDSEVDKRHTELQGAISEELDTLGSTESLQSHGTQMAGAIVAHDRLLGVAPDAKILAVRAFGGSNSTAEATTLSILKGIEWATSRGARIINMSFAGPRDPLLERALKEAHDKGVVLIAAAGNAGPKSPPLYPGADPNVIAVTATDVRDRVFLGANQGPQLSVAAPGVEIIAPAPEENYQMSTGTSIAAAQVSGVVALMLERDTTLKPDEVRKILESTATNLGPTGKNNKFGWGLVNPPKALEAVAAQLKPNNTSSKSN
jgi:filamentous hemagglutinin family protein